MAQDLIIGLAWISIVALTGALVVLIARWRRALGGDALWLLCALVLLSILHEISNLGEWSEKVHPTEPLEDYFLLLLPAVWGSFLYVFLREHSRGALDRSEQRHRSLTDDVLDTTAAGMCLLDSAGRVVWVNEAMEEYFGLSRSEIIGSDYAEWIETRLKQATDDPEGWAEQMRAAWDRGEVAGIECHVVQGENRPERWLECRVRPIGSGLYAGGRIQHFYDITERKQAAVHREELLRVLETQKAELERFVYTVSHDLKSPLITIRGFLGIVEESLAAGQIDEARRDFERITQAAQRMERLLAELLELARIGREGATAQSVPLRESLELFQAAIGHRGVAVSVRGGELAVCGHRIRLVEIFQNLVDNAIKYLGDQPEPRIEIGAEQAEGEVVCWVRDNGIGIDPAYHPKVFGLFQQLDPRRGGTGIGLTIVKRIVETHGGRIWLESEGAGSGTTFWFTLPVGGSVG
ncbi:MAG: sensor histidine kinase [Thermoguttaceae bacterium]